MSEDLAIDIGLKNGSDEFKDFVLCVENILDYGCKYSDSIREKIISQCRGSKLEIARDVIYECRNNRVHNGKLKWWQKYHSAFTTPKSSERKQQPPPVQRKERFNDNSRRNARSGNRRPMNLTFERDRDAPSYSRNSRRPSQNSSRGRRRRMNLSFDRKRGNDDEYEKFGHREEEEELEEESDEYHSDNQYVNSNNKKRKRAMSPLFEDRKYCNDVPEWPVRRSERNKYNGNNHHRGKRRR